MATDWLVDELDEKFVDQLEALQTVAAANADAVCGDTQRRWFLPPTSDWSGDPLDIAGMNAAFDRTDLNSLYVDVVSDEEQRGRQGEAMLLKLQMDYVASLERAFRTRHATSVRSRIHASGRLYGHGASGGLYAPANGTIALWLQRILEAAHDDPDET